MCVKFTTGVRKTKKEKIVYKVVQIPNRKSPICPKLREAQTLKKGTVFNYKAGDTVRSPFETTYGIYFS